MKIPFVWVVIVVLVDIHITLTTYFASQLMYFSAAPNYHEGFLRALSVTGNQHMPRLGKPSLTAHVFGDRAASAMDR